MISQYKQILMDLITPTSLSIALRNGGVSFPPERLLASTRFEKIIYVGEMLIVVE